MCVDSCLMVRREHHLSWWWPSSYHRALTFRLLSVWNQGREKIPSLSKKILPNQHVHAHALQEVISCCCFHLAFSHWMFYSFPGMLIKLMKGETGIELIMFYGSKTQWGLCLFACVFLPQLAEWLTLPDRCWDPGADGDRYKTWARHPGECCSLGCQSWLSALISHSQLNVFIIICIIFSHVIPFFSMLLSLMLFSTEALDYIKVAVLFLEYKLQTK